MKLCVGCTKMLGPKEFYPSVRTADGLNNYCKTCCKVNRSLENVRKRDKANGVSNRQIDRARRLGIAFDDTITLVEIFRRARGVCHLCHKWVQPRHASIDHIRPISLGGLHVWTNVALSHLKCNLRKGNRV